MGDKDNAVLTQQVSIAELAAGGSSDQVKQTVLVKNLADEGGWKAVVRERPTFQQFKGAFLAQMTLWFIFALLVIMLVVWCVTYPRVADMEAILGAVASGNTLEIGKERLQALQSLRSEHAKTFLDLFQFAIASLVPIFTLVAGYAFGSRETEKSGNQK